MEENFRRYPIGIQNFEDLRNNEMCIRDRVNTVISLYYYLLIVKAMYIIPSDNPIPTFRSDRCTKWGLALCTLGIIGLGIASIVYQSIDKLSFGI